MVNNSARGAYPVGGSLNMFSRESTNIDKLHCIVLSLVKKSLPTNFTSKLLIPEPPIEDPGCNIEVIVVFSDATGK